LTFQPFGYRFEITSELTPTEAKAAIRSKKTTVFDAKNGARGWIVGPFICLWFSAFDRYGPMLFGLISADNSGTRVKGRAGSDLNGVVTFTLLIPMMAWLVFMMISEGQASFGRLLVIALLFLVGGPVVYWSAHKQRKDAEPLERFLRKNLTPSAARPKSTGGGLDIREGFRLILNGDHLDAPVTQEAAQSALMRVGNGDFLIIETGSQNYIQTSCRDAEYVLEVRKGGPDKHYRAVRNDSAATGHSVLDDTFTYEEVGAALASHLSGFPLPRFLRLEPIDAR
jgi:hypothetical protein